MSLYPERRPRARTVAHIDGLLALLRRAWLANPELRLEQVVSAACADYHYNPDEEVAEKLRVLAREEASHG